MSSANAGVRKSAERLLARLLTAEQMSSRRPVSTGRARIDEQDVTALIAADLITRGANGELVPTAAGCAFVRRARLARDAASIDPYVGQHLALDRAEIQMPTGKVGVTVDGSESPLAWLARRKGRDGRPLIETEQFQAGERLRGEFTRAQLMPHITSNWSAAVAQDCRTGDRGAAHITDVVVAARQRVRQALTAVGPEFSGLLLDVCCFLKGLEDVERERGWPPRSAKVVLQLGLDRLARHFGLSASARGRPRVPIRMWLAPDATFVVDGE